MQAELASVQHAQRVPEALQRPRSVSHVRLEHSWSFRVIPLVRHVQQALPAFAALRNARPVKLAISVEQVQLNVSNAPRGSSQQMPFAVRIVQQALGAASQLGVVPHAQQGLEVMPQLVRVRPALQVASWLAPASLAKSVPPGRLAMRALRCVRFVKLVHLATLPLTNAQIAVLERTAVLVPPHALTVKVEDTASKEQPAVCPALLGQSVPLPLVCARCALQEPSVVSPRRIAPSALQEPLSSVPIRVARLVLLVVSAGLLQQPVSLVFRGLSSQTLHLTARTAHMVPSAELKPRPVKIVSTVNTVHRLQASAQTAPLALSQSSPTTPVATVPKVVGVRLVRQRAQIASLDVFVAMNLAARLVHLARSADRRRWNVTCVLQGSCSAGHSLLREFTEVQQRCIFCMLDL